MCSNGLAVNPVFKFAVQCGKCPGRSCSRTPGIDGLVKRRITGITETLTIGQQKRTIFKGVHPVTDRTPNTMVIGSDPAAKDIFQVVLTLLITSGDECTRNIPQELREYINRLRMSSELYREMSLEKSRSKTEDYRRGVYTERTAYGLALDVIAEQSMESPGDADQYVQQWNGTLPTLVKELLC